MGFVDEILFDTSNQFVASIESGMLPSDVINKMRNMKDKLLKEDEQAAENNQISNELEMAKAKLKFKTLEVENYVKKY